LRRRVVKVDPIELPIKAVMDPALESMVDKRFREDVRRTALIQAVRLHAGEKVQSWTMNDVVETARIFEEYLLGEPISPPR
jgi:hypothetical protein